MIRPLSIAIATIAVMMAAGSTARAQNYPWCAYYGDDSGENCGFSTYEQCMAAISGNAGSCERNTQYVPPGAVAPRSVAPQAQRRLLHKQPG